MTRSLFEIVETHAGKTTDKWRLYVHEYDRLFELYRAHEIFLLEIGVQNGGSLDIWSDYFQQARLLVGCDIDESCRGLKYADTRVQVVVGDANAATTRDKILSLSQRYDLIIDDGSHTSSDIVKSFALYFGALAEGGLYVVEDLHCSYWSDFQGGLNNPFSSIQFFKSMCDIVNHQSWGLSLSRKDLLKDFSERYGAQFPEDLLAQIHSVEFLNSICVIRKACAEDNTLGERVVRGGEATVNPGPLQVDGHLLEVLPQKPAVVVALTPMYFDEAYYLTANHDVAVAGIDALEHYLANGKAEGRHPTADMALLATVEKSKASGDLQTVKVQTSLDRIEARQQLLDTQLTSLTGQAATLADLLSAQGSNLAVSFEACQKQMELGQLDHSSQIQALAQSFAEQKVHDRQWQVSLKVDLAAFNEATHAKLASAQLEHTAQLAALAQEQAKQNEQTRQNEELIKFELSVLKECFLNLNAVYLDSKQYFDARVEALEADIAKDKLRLAWRIDHPFKSLWNDLVSRKRDD